MLYVVEIRRERPLAKVLSDLREWLDAERFEPVTFRCTTENDCIICRLEFQFESEASACAAVFNGTVTQLGERQARGPLAVKRPLEGLCHSLVFKDHPDDKPGPLLVRAISKFTGTHPNSSSHLRN